MKDGRVSRLAEFALIGIASLVAMLPMLSDCRLAAGHDFYFNFVSSQQFAKQFFAGELYPRWMVDMNAGMGNPLFFYYGPVPYWLTSMLVFLSGGAMGGCQPLGASFLVSLFGSGLVFYAFLNTKVSRVAAVVAAIIYMISSYHLSIEIYTRTALAAAWSYVWLPLAFLAAGRLARKREIDVVGLGMSLGLLLMTHLPSFLIAFPFIMGYAVYSFPRHSLSNYGRALLSVLLALGLSSAYWLPALATGDFVSMQHMRGGFLEYGNNFLFEGPLVERDVFIQYWRQIESATLVMALASFVASLNFHWRARSSLDAGREARFWLSKEYRSMLIALTVALMMTFPVSKTIWNWLPVLQRLQFPWRYNFIVVFASAALIGFAFHVAIPSASGKDSLLRSTWFALTSIILSILLVVMLQAFCTTGVAECPFYLRIARVLGLVGILVFSGFFAWQVKASFGSNILLLSLISTTALMVIHQSYYRIMALRGNIVYLGATAQQAVGRPEHLPNGVPEMMFQSPEMVAFSKKHPRVRVTRGSGAVSVLSWKPRALKFWVTASTPVELEVKQFNYPGWTAFGLVQSSAIPVKTSSSGLIAIGLEPGNRVVEIRLEPLKYESIGNRVSIFSFLLVGVVVFRGRLRGLASR